MPAIQPPKAEITKALVASNPACVLVMLQTAINAGMTKTVNLDVERVERPAAETRPERPALVRSKLAIPIEHGTVWMDSRSDQTGPAEIVIAGHRASKDARLSTGYGEAIQG